MSTDVYRDFQEVQDNLTKFEPRMIFRSSAPNYEWMGSGSDASQRFDKPALDFLKAKKITAVISLNEYPYSKTNTNADAQLRTANIDYLHLRVDDFTSPTIEQFRTAMKFIEDTPKDDTSRILIHCGFGQGRTGTLLSAIQLYCTSGQFPDKAAVQNGANGVEKDVQKDMLEVWRKLC